MQQTQYCVQAPQSAQAQPQAAGPQKLDVAALFAGIYLGDNDATSAVEANAASTSGRSGEGGTGRGGGKEQSPHSSKDVSGSGMQSAQPIQKSASDKALERATSKQAPVKESPRTASAQLPPAAPKPIALTARNLVLKEKVEKVGKVAKHMRAASRPESIAMPGVDEEADEGAPARGCAAALAQVSLNTVGLHYKMDALGACLTLSCLPATCMSVRPAGECCAHWIWCKLCKLDS